MTYRTRPIILCEHRQTEEKIHEFVFRAASKQAVDEWFMHLESLLTGCPQAEAVCVILNVERSGMLPLTYTQKRARQFLALHSIRVPLRIVFLHAANFPLDLVQSFWRSMRINLDYEVACYLSAERENALAWLRET